MIGQVFHLEPIYAKLLNFVDNHCQPYSGCTFSGLLTDGGTKRPPLTKICHTYPTIMKLDAVIPYLEKIQKIYESHDTLPGFC